MWRKVLSLVAAFGFAASTAFANIVAFDGGEWTGTYFGQHVRIDPSPPSRSSTYKVNGNYSIKVPGAGSQGGSIVYLPYSARSHEERLSPYDARKAMGIDQDQLLTDVPTVGEDYICFWMKFMPSSVSEGTVLSIYAANWDSNNSRYLYYDPNYSASDPTTGVPIGKIRMSASNGKVSIKACANSNLDSFGESCSNVLANAFDSGAWTRICVHFIAFFSYHELRVYVGNFYDFKNRNPDLTFQRSRGSSIREDPFVFIFTNEYPASYDYYLDDIVVADSANSNNLSQDVFEHLLFNGYAIRLTENGMGSNFSCTNKCNYSSSSCGCSAQNTAYNCVNQVGADSCGLNESDGDNSRIKINAKSTNVVPFTISNPLAGNSSYRLWAIGIAQSFRKFGTGANTYVVPFLYFDSTDNWFVTTSRLYPFNADGNYHTTFQVVDFISSSSTYTASNLDPIEVGFRIPSTTGTAVTMSAQNVQAWVASSSVPTTTTTTTTLPITHRVIIMGKNTDDPCDSDGTQPNLPPCPLLHECDCDCTYYR